MECCFSCGVELKSVYPEMSSFDKFREEYPNHCEDALIIIFQGGYGMRVDPLVDTDLTIILCYNCTNKMIEAVPWLNRVKALRT
jgi:hypothetical protein